MGELANEVELWRMETSSAHDGFRVPFISDQTDDARKPDALVSQSVLTRTSICAASASSAWPGNMETNSSLSATITTRAAGAAFGNQHGIGGATNRNHSVDAGEVPHEESPANLDEMLSEDLRRTPAFLSTFTAEMKVNSHNAIGREVIEVATAAAAGKTAERIKGKGNDSNTSLTPPTFEEIITFEDLFDESIESLSQHSLAGFVEEVAPGKSLKEFV